MKATVPRRPAIYARVSTGFRRRRISSGSFARSPWGIGWTLIEFIDWHQGCEGVRLTTAAQRGQEEVSRGCPFFGEKGVAGTVWQSSRGADS
jgi:hypothetical protein